MGWRWGKRLRRTRLSWRLAVFSFASAAIFWTLNALGKRYTTQLNFALHYDYNTEGLVVVQPPEERIRLSVTGIGWELLQRTSVLKRSPLILSLDTPTHTKYLPREALFDKFAEQLQPIRLNFIVPSGLPLDIQRKQSKRVGVVLDSASLRLAPGYRITSPFIYTPDSLQITGAEKILNQYPAHYILRLDSTRVIQAAFDQDIPITLTQPHLSSEQARVQLRFDVARFEEKLHALPVHRENFPVWRNTEVVVLDSVLAVRYTIQSDYAALIRASDFYFGADYQTRRFSDTTLQLRLITSPNDYIWAYISDFSYSPTRVRFRYVRKRR